MELDCATIVGRVQTLRYPAPPKPFSADPQYGRQVRLYGDRGQEILSAQKVAIIGAGGAGSLINEFLARLGVGHIIMVDYDRLDPKGTNNPRVVGARPRDLNLGLVARLLRRKPEYKVTISERVARDAKPNIHYEAIVGNVTEPAVAERLIDCDAIFLAADSMQARLVVNAICHQYLIPTWQVGAKVVSDPEGNILDVFSVVRHLVPGTVLSLVQRTHRLQTAGRGGNVHKTKRRATVRRRRTSPKCHYPQRGCLFSRGGPVSLQHLGTARNA